MRDDFFGDVSTVRLFETVETLQTLQGYDSSIKKLKKEIETRFSHLEPNKNGVKILESSDGKLRYHSNGLLKKCPTRDAEERDNPVIEISPFELKLKEKEITHPDKALLPGKMNVRYLTKHHGFLRETPQFYKYLYCLNKGVKLKRTKKFSERELFGVIKAIDAIKNETVSDDVKVELIQSVMRTNYGSDFGVWYGGYEYDDMRFAHVYEDTIYELIKHCIMQKIAVDWQKNTAEDRKYYEKSDNWDFKHKKKYMCLILNPTKRQIGNLENHLGWRGRSLTVNRTQINFDTAEELLTQFKDMFKDYLNKEDIYTTLDKMGFDVARYKNEEKQSEIN